MAKKMVPKKDEGTAVKVDFEQALGQLESIVHRLEDGETGLSESLAQYEKGVKLLRQCYEMLDGAQRKIELLTGVDAEGRPIAEALDDATPSLESKSRRRERGGKAEPHGDVVSGSGGDVDESERMT